MHPAVAPRARALALGVVVCVAALPAAAGLKALKGFDQDLEKHGVTERYSERGMAALLEMIREEIAEAEAQAGQEEDDEDREKLARIAEAGRGVLARVPGDPVAASAAYPALKSLLYSMRVEVRGERRTFFLMSLIRLLGNLSQKVPYLSPEERARALGPDEALLEAANLVDAETGTVYDDPAQLAGLSSEQVSRLDVRADDYLWYDEKQLLELKARHGTAWKALEARVESRIAEAVRGPYALDRARRLLVFRGIRSSATSPKIDAEDLQGRSWKVKWGEEVHTEPIANHLYVELGGKFADLVYANKGGQAELVVVLDPADAAEGKERCETVPTVAELAHCLRKSKYKFDVSAYVVSRGVVTEATLREEPFASATGPTASLVGREFVTFNESSVELQVGAGDGFERIGAGPMSSKEVRADRARRGLVVLTYWIHNKDAKDVNNKGLVDTVSGAYVEYMHDLGASLGSIEISGSPNRMTVGDDFLRRRRHKVKLGSNMLYRPKIFDEATYADAAWMARKIARLSREEILEAVAGTRWPDFQQQVMASKLIARRNDIARAFDVGEAMAYEAAPMVVSLRSPADRLDVVTRYQLAIATRGDAAKAVAALEEFMTGSGIALTDGMADFEDAVDVARETFLETNACTKSLIVAWLERTIHPAGLARRTRRRADDKPLAPCQPTRRTLGIR